ncbi:hypothetical protein CALVIDRAFT_536365 [Calocera viscosa TUFC12733]|uniref:Signal peptidase complex subunit 1 n=1 Tax=Calocera viscosa (strain TUFC12733) TaxID=1330018 RepID=A0A167N4Y7_CALVF|nr:hypothetical protein CALVIDRAFT_536365 [Calocera viscosa TUFC12733]
MDILNNVQRSVQRVIEGKIDFTAQKHAETATYAILSLTTVLSFLAGYIAQDLRFSLAVFGISLLALLLALVPPWPYLNAHPVPWRAPVPTSTSASPSSKTD